MYSNPNPIKSMTFIQGKYKWLSLTIPEDHDCTPLNHITLTPDK